MAMLWNLWMRTVDNNSMMRAKEINNCACQEITFVPYSKRIRNFFDRYPGAMKPFESPKIEV